MLPDRVSIGDEIAVELPTGEVWCGVLLARTPTAIKLRLWGLRTERSFALRKVARVATLHGCDDDTRTRCTRAQAAGEPAAKRDAA